MSVTVEGAHARAIARIYDLPSESKRIENVYALLREVKTMENALIALGRHEIEIAMSKGASWADLQESTGLSRQKLEWLMNLTPRATGGVSLESGPGR